MNGTANTPVANHPAANHLFNINDGVVKLSYDKAELLLESP